MSSPSSTQDPDERILAEFIADGHLARHVRRMRRLYAERQAGFVRLCQQQLSGLLDVHAVERAFS